MDGNIHKSSSVNVKHRFKVEADKQKTSRCHGKKLKMENYYKLGNHKTKCCLGTK